jgi:hypothetical protein
MTMEKPRRRFNEDGYGVNEDDLETKRKTRRAGIGG